MVVRMPMAVRRVVVFMLAVGMRMGGLEAVCGVLWWDGDVFLCGVDLSRGWWSAGSKEMGRFSVMVSSTSNVCLLRFCPVSRSPP